MKKGEGEAGERKRKVSGELHIGRDLTHCHHGDDEAGVVTAAHKYRVMGHELRTAIPNIIT